MIPLGLPAAGQIMALGHANFTPAVGRRHGQEIRTVSGHAQKAVALAVVVSRGVPARHEDLARMASCALETTVRALNSLIEKGVVVHRLPLPAAKRPCGYLIDWDRLLAFVPPEQIGPILAATPPQRRSA